MGGSRRRWRRFSWALWLALARCCIQFGERGRTRLYTLRRPRGRRRRSDFCFSIRTAVRKVGRWNGFLLWVECVSFGANETLCLERISLNLHLHVLGSYDEIKIVPCAHQELEKCTCTHLSTSPKLSLP